MPEELPYLVVWATAAQVSLQELWRKLPESNGGNKLAKVLGVIKTRLRRDPTGLGEIYRSRGVVQEYLAVCEFLVIDFAVDTKRKVVRVRECRFLSGRGKD